MVWGEEVKTTENRLHWPRSPQTIIKGLFSRVADKVGTNEFEKFQIFDV
jgi:hypothetical protein